MKEQKLLIENIGVSIEDRLRLSPLASRIYALLILSSYAGISFDEIREVVKASKSSISVNINVLIQLGYISFLTKSGDRKRYFKIAKYASIISLENYLHEIDSEKLMLIRINTFNKKYHPEKFISEKSLGGIFEEYLLKKEKLVAETIQKMSNFQNTEI
jgi:DNA-binding transcriptional regulator GbsR (MarR family)